jgi:ADP-ribosylglycohydrolase
MEQAASLRARLRRLARQKAEAGYEVSAVEDAIAALPESFDAALELVRRLSEARLREGWPYVEPDELDAIKAEADWPTGSVATVSPADAAPRVEAAFLGSVCGCILGKPVEFDPTLADLEQMLGAVGEWPITDYISEKIEPAVVARRGAPMAYWNRTYRERIRWVMPDDDLNYDILGMLLLEAHGRDLTTRNVRDAWLQHLPVNATFGPERDTLAADALRAANPGLPVIEDWLALLYGGDQRGLAHCGAQIRADAFGYACPGDPALAAELSYRDAALTHKGTGLYATMWTAAAIAAAQAEPDHPLDIFRTALKVVPRRSRFYEAVSFALSAVAAAPDWRAGYDAIHVKFGEFGHYGVYQESATLVNTLRFARRVDEAICVQVMQGNDTDSYGATAGSLAGAYLGPGLLDEARWLAPFNDTIYTALAWFPETSLSRLAKRMGDLPRRLAAGETTGTTLP